MILFFFFFLIKREKEPQFYCIPLGITFNPMQHLIAQYLFQNKHCTLPGLGTLSVVTKNAASDFVNKQILPPIPAITFSSEENDAEGFVNYVAANEHKNYGESIEEVNDYVGLLKQGKPINGVGQFLVDASGNIEFKAAEINSNLLQAVRAERVIHPEAEHVMLVGDKETTNTQMTEYYTEDPVIKDGWWIWAIVLGVIGITAIFIYLNDSNSNDLFGSAINISNL